MKHLILSDIALRSHRIAILAFVIACATSACVAQKATWRETLDASYKAIEPRKFSPVIASEWKGRGISYGPYRVGQAPWGPMPTKQQITEDLQILAKDWDLIRVYGSTDPTESILQIIRDKKLSLRVLLGAWIEPESGSGTDPDKTEESARQANETQVKNAIRLANKYSEQVIAVNVGNETQVYWSGHKTNPEVLVKYVRKVRAETKVPITTADDFNYWNKPESKYVAREIDFIVTHAYAMWNGLNLTKAVPWTKEMYQDVCSKHPGKTIVLGEAGWATQVHTEGEQAKLIKGKAGEIEQSVFATDFIDWAIEDRVCFFYFEAFDEPWKGGEHPNEVEKNWGIYRVDRTPKTTVKKLKRTTSIKY